MTSISIPEARTQTPRPTYLQFRCFAKAKAKDLVVDVPVAGEAAHKPADVARQKQRQ